jgi:uncharacterized protein (DUF58 family)
MVTEQSTHLIAMLELYARRLLQGISSGEHAAFARGTGFEFDQLRDYQQGDDFRFIDWKASARSQRMLVRQYREESNPSIIILLDGSGSGNYGSGELLKYERALHIAGSIGLAAHYTKHAVGLLLFSETIEFSQTLTHNKSTLLKGIEQLQNYKTHHKKTSLAAALEYVLRRFPPYSMVCIISDFLDNNFEGALRQVVRYHDVVALRIQDKHEQVFPFALDGEMELCDPETGLSVSCSTYLELERLRQASLVWYREQDALFKRLGIDNLVVRLDKPFIEDLCHFLKQRKERYGSNILRYL